MSKNVSILASLTIILLLLFQYGAYCQIPLNPDSDLSIANNQYLTADNSWLGDWLYRKSHGITSGEDAGENFQMSFTIYYGVGDDSSNEVYCQTNCQNDFGDLRFTSSDGVTEYDYWIQNCSIGVKALFWVEITESLNVSRTMYIYYGHPFTTTTSNGNATFRFFEDFSRPDSLTVGNGWTEDESSTEVSISNGGLNVTGPPHRYAHVVKPLFGEVNLVLAGNIYASYDEFEKLSTALCLYWDDHIWVRTGWRRANYFFTQENYGACDGSSEGVAGVPSERGDEWYRFKIMLGENVRSFYSLDDGYTWDMLPYGSRPSVYSGAPTHIILGRGYSDCATGNLPNPDLDNNEWYSGYPEANSIIDDVFVRSYSVNVPAHGGYGGEEINPEMEHSLPVLSHPDDVIFEEGAMGYNITWTLYDCRSHRDSYR